MTAHVTVAQLAEMRVQLGRSRGQDLADFMLRRDFVRVLDLTADQDHALQECDRLSRIIGTGTLDDARLAGIAIGRVARAARPTEGAHHA